MHYLIAAAVLNLAGDAIFDPAHAATPRESCCGTFVTPDQAQRTESLISDGVWKDATKFLAHKTRDETPAVFVAMTVHVVRYSDGSEGISNAWISEAIAKLNNDLHSTGMVFFQEGETIYIDDDEYAILFWNEFCPLLEEQAVPATINVYFVPDFVGWCGRASFPGDRCQGIVVDNGCADPSLNSSTFSHEIGHYLHIYHTHETYFGEECVSGSNCDTAGDLLCDTAADPNLQGVVNSSTCQYEGVTEDACGSGESYDPDTSNIMSYATSICQDFFSEEQLSVMTWSAYTERLDHLRGEGACCLGSSCLLLSPLDCATVRGEYMGASTTCVEVVCQEGIWTVDDDSPANFDNIQAAVDAASDGDEIIVSPGTYTSTQDGHVVDMKGKAVTLRSTSGPEATFIDGEYSRRGIACFSGETDQTVIEGFTIINGRTASYDYDGDGTVDIYDNAGGGMHNYRTSPTLINCTLTNNASDYFGGGMYNADSSPILTNCTIANNTAEFGGGMCNMLGASPRLNDCVIENNAVASGSSNAQGGGMYNGLNTSPTLLNCTFSGNLADFGGGMRNSFAANPMLTNCVFTDNTAPQGGGMYNYATSPTLANCHFTDNTSDYFGGGMYNYESSPSLTDTTVCGNVVDQIAGDPIVDNGGNSITQSCLGDCPGDMTGDLLVNTDDFSEFLIQFGQSGPNLSADLDGDLDVDTDDFSVFLINFGNDCTAPLRSAPATPTQATLRRTPSPVSTR